MNIGALHVVLVASSILTGTIANARAAASAEPRGGHTAHFDGPSRCPHRPGTKRGAADDRATRPWGRFRARILCHTEPSIGNSSNLSLSHLETSARSLRLTSRHRVRPA